MREDVAALSLRIPETTADPDSVGGDPLASPPPKEAPPGARRRKQCCVFWSLAVVAALAIGLGVGLVIKRWYNSKRYVPRSSITVQLQVPATGLTSELGAALRCAFLGGFRISPPPALGR